MKVTIITGLCIFLAIGSFTLSSDKKANSYLTDNDNLLYLYMKKAKNAEGQKLTAKQIDTYISMPKSFDVNIQTSKIQKGVFLYIEEDLQTAYVFDWSDGITDQGTLAYTLK